MPANDVSFFLTPFLDCPAQKAQDNGAAARAQAPQPTIDQNMDFLCLINFSRRFVDDMIQTPNDVRDKGHNGNDSDNG